MRIGYAVAIHLVVHLNDLNDEMVKITSKYLPGDVKICFPMTPTVGARYPYTKNIGVCFSEMLQRPPSMKCVCHGVSCGVCVGGHREMDTVTPGCGICQTFTNA